MSIVRTLSIAVLLTASVAAAQRSTNKRPVGQWMTRFEEWLADSGLLRKK